MTDPSAFFQPRHDGCRAVATERLSLLADGRVLYRLKHPWRDGSTHVLFEPLELVAKLAALVPPPRFNLVRYHGVLAPAARSRPEIVPPSPPLQAETSPHSGCRAHRRTGGDSPRPAIDVLECPQSSGRMRILAAILAVLRNIRSDKRISLLSM
jgi:Putative transposase